MSTWEHKRLGRIVGTEVEQDDPGEWMFIALAEDVNGRACSLTAGEIMTARRSSLTLVTESGDLSCSSSRKALG